MSQRLAIGLVEREAGWVSILEQIGVWFERVDWNRLDASHNSVIIVNRPLGLSETARLEEYLRHGGAVLDGGALAERHELPLRTRAIASIVDASPPFDRTWIVDIHDRLRSLAAATHLGGTITLGEHRGGWLAHVPFDIAAIHRSSAAARRRFHSPTGHHPDEVVARVPRHPYRVIAESALEWLHARRGLPFVHRWYFPDDARSVFAYRIDTDYGTPEHLSRLARLAESYGAPLSLYLHVGAHESHMGVFREMKRHELGVHGYRHRTFAGYEANWGNIAEARAVMTAHGIELGDDAGFAAPTGRWNRALDRALREHRFAYSSEFTLDYDGLPSYPWIGATSSTVLQVPIHPVSIGNLTRAHAGEAESIAYYDAVIDRQLAHRAPVFLYHHPLQESWQAVESILARARDERIMPVTLGSFVAWWRRRERSWMRARLEGSTLALELPEQTDRLSVRMLRPDGRESFIAAAGAYELDALASSPAPRVGVAPPADLAGIRRTTVTMLRHSLEDAISRFRQ